MYTGKLNKKIIKRLNKYEKKLNDTFPLMVFSGDQKDLLKELNKCISTNKKYDISFWLDNDCES